MGGCRSGASASWFTPTDKGMPATASRIASASAESVSRCRPGQPCCSRFPRWLPPWAGKSKQLAVCQRPQPVGLASEDLGAQSRGYLARPLPSVPEDSRFQTCDNTPGLSLQFNTTLPTNQSRRFGAVMDFSLRSRGRPPHRFRPWLRKKGPETMQLPLGHHPLRGGVSSVARRPSMHPRPRGRLHRPATWVRYPIDWTPATGRGPRMVPASPGEAGLKCPAGELGSTAIDGPHRLFSRLHMHPRRPPSFAFCARGPRPVGALFREVEPSVRRRLAGRQSQPWPSDGGGVAYLAALAS
jgi:hypothetical protein